MPINITCPGCRKRFQVSEKFAGKSGPCPVCKQIIRVPTKEEEVVIHGPEDFEKGGRGASGELVLKPIARTDTKLSPLWTSVIVVSAILVFVLTWIAGKQELFSSADLGLMMCGIGLLIVSPALVIAGYTFLRDDELEPHRGKSLFLRAAICSLGYIILWAVFSYVCSRGVFTGELYIWLVVAPPFFVVGAMLAYAAFDLDFGNGFFHYAFYVLVTILLRWAAGLGWIWTIKNGP